MKIITVKHLLFLLITGITITGIITSCEKEKLSKVNDNKTDNNKPLYRHDPSDSTAFSNLPHNHAQVNYKFWYKNNYVPLAGIDTSNQDLMMVVGLFKKSDEVHCFDNRNEAKLFLEQKNDDNSKLLLEKLKQQDAILNGLNGVELKEDNPNKPIIATPQPPSFIGNQNSNLSPSSIVTFQSILFDLALCKGNFRIHSHASPNLGNFRNKTTTVLVIAGVHFLYNFDWFKGRSVVVFAVTAGCVDLRGLNFDNMANSVL